MEDTGAPVFSLDEVGRGPLWGPVVAAAVVLPLECPDDNPLWKAIRDSKKVSEKKRPLVAEYIKSIAISYGIGEADSQEIDDVNILQATMRAMHRAMDVAWRKCPPDAIPSLIKVDGPHFVPYTPPGMDTESIDHMCIVDGDSLDRGIAAASIIAKVHRDEWIIKYASENPEVAPYHLDKNKGYGTAVHMAALKTAGVHPLHRRSFAPVRRALGGY